MRAIRPLVLASLCVAASSAPVLAQDSYKVGSSVGLSGYLASIDRPFKDGILLAAEALNKAGGIKGRKITVLVEDMRSEPVDAVTAVKKMITAEKVAVLINGCSSAGNGAAIPLAERAETPMVVCSTLPPNKDTHKWAFSMLAAPSAEVEPRIAYLAERAKIKKVGLLYDPTPYAGLQKTAAEQLAAKYGLQVVGIEKYQQNDADMTAYLTKLTAAGAEAIVKMGAGPSSITAAKGLKQLGLKIPLLSSAEDLVVMREAAATLNEQFFFVAHPAQVYDALPEGSEAKKAVARFVALWKAQHGDRDPSWGSRGWDALHLVAAAVERGGAPTGAKMRDAFEATSGWRGTSAEYTFGADSHYGVRKNPWYLAQVVNGTVKIVQ